jgi:hypothetical protein
MKHIKIFESSSGRDSSWKDNLNRILAADNMANRKTPYRSDKGKIYLLDGWDNSDFSTKRQLGPGSYIDLSFADVNSLISILKETDIKANTFLFNRENSSRAVNEFIENLLALRNKTFVSPSSDIDLALSFVYIDLSSFKPSDLNKKF